MLEIKRENYLHYVKEFLVAVIALVFTDKYVQLVDQFTFDLFEVAPVSLLAVDHVEKDGERSAPQLWFRHQGNLKELTDHARNEVNFVVADSVPHGQDLETHLYAHITTFGQHFLSLAFCAFL